MESHTETFNSDKTKPKPDIKFRKPTLADGEAIYRLIERCPPLDLNSSYLYFLQASHFADTCVVAEMEGDLVGFVSAYYLPEEPRSLFVWQIAVDERARGQGLAKRLLRQLMANQSNSYVTEILCTISPSNKASQALFNGFAKDEGLKVIVEPFLTEAHFASLGHEAEEIYRLAAPNHQNLFAYWR